AALEFRPERSRSSGEARFDYSRSYHLMWRKANEVSYQKLLALNSTDITLQVDDIADIMRYIKKRVPEADIPIEQASFFNLYHNFLSSPNRPYLFTTLTNINYQFLAYRDTLINASRA